MSDFNDFGVDEQKAINYFIEDVDFQIQNEAEITKWVKQTLEQEKHHWTTLNFIFCSDEYLHKINLNYLNHDTYTDIITFPYSTDPIEGDIFISIERVKDNAKKFAVSFDRELHRVVIHGVLHLMGYDDKNPEDKKQMTLKENQYLSLLNF